MSRKARHRYILDKAKAAAIAAIGCYNQPNFPYREESFCILIINAWDLLLKAKIIKDNQENVKAIYEEDKKARRKDGKPFIKPKYRKNKAGIFITKSFKSIIDYHQSNNLLDTTLIKQLEVLYVSRNTFIHFASSDSKNAKVEDTMLEVFSATLQSFQQLCGDWFNEKMTDNLVLIPLAFDLPKNFDSQIPNKEAEKLLIFIQNQENELPKSSKSKHSIQVNVRVKFERSKEGLAVNVRPNGAPIAVDSEDKFKNKYPWSFKDDLIPHLQKEFTSFRRSPKFWSVLKKLKQDDNYCGERHLDWNKKQGTKKWFYSPNIVPVIAEKLGLTK